MVIWKNVVGFEGIYSVSSCGQVRRDVPSRGFGSRSFAGKIMSQKKCTDGYRSVSLYPLQGKQKQIHVHRLVAIAFIGPVPSGLVVNHKDGIKHNNDLSNLEYLTTSQNIKHAYASGLAKGKPGETNSNVVLNDDAIRAIRLLHSEGWTNNSISRAMRINPGKISRIVNGHIWKAVA